jgi:excisionase family DNA binding protein
MRQQRPVHGHDWKGDARHDAAHTKAEDPMQDLTNDSLAFTYKQVARAANLSERTVRKLVRSGQLAVVHIGRAARVPKPAVLQLCGIERPRPESRESE